MWHTMMIREIKSGELEILEDLLYEAIFQPDPIQRLPREVIHRPELRAYIEDWGRPDDLCLVAELDGRIVGGVWTRVFSETFQGFGWLDHATPELAISLFEEYRGQGIGTRLLQEMLQLLRLRGYSRVSLSVSKQNRAVRLYRDIGFEVVREEQGEYLMQLWLREM